MSAEAVTSFISKVKEDPALLEQLKAVDTSDPDAAVDKLVRIANDQGYDFTADEYKQNFQAELSEEELHQMSAGRGTAPTAPMWA